MKKYVLGFAFDLTQSKVLLIKKQSPQWQKNLFNGIGGKIEKTDDSIQAAMCREFKEECGIDTSTEQWNHYCVLHGEDFVVDCFYSFSIDINKAKTLTNEEVFNLDINDLFLNQFNQCISNLKWLIPLCLDKDIPHIKNSTFYSKNP